MKKFLRIFGPGVITGAADDDPSGIATYSQTGAKYGFGLLWLSLFSLPLMGVIQEMCARIGLVTGGGLAENIRENYPKSVLYITIGLLFIANTFNISADLRAMADSVHLIIPSLNILFVVLILTIFSSLLQIFVPYKTYVKFLKFLVLFLLCYILTAYLVKVDWLYALKSLVIPSFEFSKDSVLLICAILGTTISPYLFFWQTSQEIEDEKSKGKNTLKQLQRTTHMDIFKMRVDVWFGMFVSNSIMFFIIVVCASVLFTNGITDIQSSAQAAEALKPLAGNFAYLLFTIGIIGTGLLAIPTLAGSSAYAFSETFKRDEGLNKKFSEAKFFYVVIITSMVVAFLMNLINLDPIKTLIYSAVVNAIVSPIMLFLILRISGKAEIMGKWKNGKITNFIGWFVVLAMSVVAIVTIVFLFK